MVLSFLLFIHWQIEEVSELRSPEDDSQCFCYVVLDLLKRELDKLQRVQNCAARLVSGIRRSDHITPVMKDLHWLPVGARIDLKILLLTFKSLNDLAPYWLPLGARIDFKILL